jgi:hypothetical protein
VVASMNMTQRWTRNRQGKAVPVVAWQRPVEMMTYTFPLHRKGGIVWARAILPVDLHVREAERFCTMVGTLAFTDEQLAS